MMTMLIRFFALTVFYLMNDKRVGLTGGYVQ